MYYRRVIEGYRPKLGFGSIDNIIERFVNLYVYAKPLDAGKKNLKKDY